jgi:hypothetical protein
VHLAVALDDDEAAAPVDRAVVAGDDVVGIDS